jgi:ribosomal protein L37E
MGNKSCRTFVSKKYGLKMVKVKENKMEEVRCLKCGSKRISYYDNKNHCLDCGEIWEKGRQRKLISQEEYLQRINNPNITEKEIDELWESLNS